MVSAGVSIHRWDTRFNQWNKIRCFSLVAIPRICDFVIDIPHVWSECQNQALKPWTTNIKRRWFSWLETSISMGLSSQPCLMKPEGMENTGFIQSHAFWNGFFPRWEKPVTRGTTIARSRIPWHLRLWHPSIMPCFTFVIITAMWGRLTAWPSASYPSTASWPGSFLSKSWQAWPWPSSYKWEYDYKLSKLVGGFNPSEKYESQLGLLFPIYERNVPNHQPV